MIALLTLATLIIIALSFIITAIFAYKIYNAIMHNYTQTGVEIAENYDDLTAYEEYLRDIENNTYTIQYPTSFEEQVLDDFDDSVEIVTDKDEIKAMQNKRS